MLHRVLDHGSFGEHHLSVRADRQEEPERATPSIFASLAAARRDGGLEPLQQKVFGPSSHRAQVLDARARAG